MRVGAPRRARRKALVWPRLSSRRLSMRDVGADNRRQTIAAKPPTVFWRDSRAASSPRAKRRIRCRSPGSGHAVVLDDDDRHGCRARAARRPRAGRRRV